MGWEESGGPCAVENVLFRLQHEARQNSDGTPLKPVVFGGLPLQNSGDAV
jgi:hypothetical protein